MKWNASLLVAVVVACASEREPPGHGNAGSGGRGQSGGDHGGNAGSGAVSTPESGGAGGVAPSGGRAPKGGTSAADASGVTAGIHQNGGSLAAGGPSEGGATSGESGGPSESGSSGASVVSGGTGGNAGAGGEMVSEAGRPCDIYASGDTPCAAAYSTVRALFEAYDGPLYQVRRADGELQDIDTLASGYANAAAQDAFCGKETCTISVLYDQSENRNDLTEAPPDCYQDASPLNGSTEADAKGRSLQVSGHDVYALRMVARNAYRANQTSGMPTGSEEQGIYEVVDGTRVGTACCWDFGNGSTDNCTGPVGTTNALFFGTAYWGKGAGDGPWFMADFQTGVWAGGDGASDVTNPDLPSSPFDFAFGVLKTGSSSYTIRVGDAQTGGLTTGYDGAAPDTFQMQGAVILGIGSDGGNVSHGTFFEGAITNGRPSDAVDDAVLRNVQAAGYGK
jgi:non-reducing end alpha-L-arabinofuranosidase